MKFWVITDGDSKVVAVAAASEVKRPYMVARTAELDFTDYPMTHSLFAVSREPKNQPHIGDTVCYT